MLALRIAAPGRHVAGSLCSRFAPALGHALTPNLSGYPSQALRNMATALPRDPDRPKIPLSAYFRFSAAYREKNGLKGGTTTMKQSGEAWKKLSDVEKKPFQDVATADRNIYKKKFEEYKASGKLDAWKSDPEKPKRPATSYLAWSVERRKAPHLSKLSLTEASKQIATEWKALPQAEKDALQANYSLRKEAFEKEMQAYKASGKEEAWLQRTGRLEVTKKAEAKQEAAKQKELAAKAKAKLAKEKEKLKLKQQKEKLVKAKAAKKAAEDKEKMKLKRQKEQATKAQVAEKKAKAKEKLKLKQQKEKELKAKAAQKKKMDMEKAKAKQAKAKASSPKV